MTPSSTLQHGVLAYSGPQGFTDAAVEMVAGALSEGAAAVIFADADQIAQVRAELGRDATAVVAIDRSVAGRNPARVLPTLQTLVDANREAGVRCIGDPVRADDSAAVRREVALHELILQLPEFRAWNCRLTCAYDDSLDSAVVDRIAVSHDARSDPSDAVDRAR